VELLHEKSRASWWGDPRTGVTRGLVEHVTANVLAASLYDLQLAPEAVDPAIDHAPQRHNIDTVVLGSG
jgi:hypothetical protein